MKLRIIVRDMDCEAACNVSGAKAVIGFKTFDIDAPPELAAWLSMKTPAVVYRTIEGVEVLREQEGGAA